MTVCVLRKGLNKEHYEEVEHEKKEEEVECKVEEEQVQETTTGRSKHMKRGNYASWKQ